MEVVDEGHATVFNKIMPQRQILGELAYMAQSDALYEQLSGRENLQFFAEMRGVKNISNEIDRVRNEASFIIGNRLFRES